MIITDSVVLLGENLEMVNNRLDKLRIPFEVNGLNNNKTVCIIDYKYVKRF